MQTPIQQVEKAFLESYWPQAPAVLQRIRDHARACRLRSDAGKEPWGRLAAFAADMTRRSMRPWATFEEDTEEQHVVRISALQRLGTRAVLHDLLFTLITEGE